ncbi:hypothetical protein [Clostridium lacusfryxellense]|uniref:hypothetical protein n=1 Tax=Clostridium lacusfryxellense TaxID=205328 RepID=UPI0028B1DEFD|nr:hypothetical protein [Clostridium lacusfryxellense]
MKCDNLNTKLSHFIFHGFYNYPLSTPTLGILASMLATPWQLSNWELKSLPAVNPKCAAPLHFELLLTSYTIH